MGISVLIHTYNEEKNIRNCLETVKWADEIVIVDMYSTDNTVDIAKEYTDKIFYFEYCGYVEPARKFGVENTSEEWVLVVDADELVPLKLKEKVMEIMEEDIADVVYIPHNNYFFGRLLKGTGWGALQDKHPRFFKKKFVSFSEAVHNIFKIDKSARIYYIKDPEAGFIHFNFVDVEHFLEKLNRYTTIEALNMYNGIKSKPNFVKLVLKLLREFIFRLLKGKGYKDGYYGFCLTMLMLAYHVSSYLKYKLMENYSSTNPRQEILKEYERIARSIIKEYQNEFT